MLSKPTATIKLDYHLQLFYGSTSGDPVQVLKKQRYFNFIIHNALEINKQSKPAIYTGDDYYTFELPRYADKDTSSGLYHIPEHSFKVIETMLGNAFDLCYTNHIAACDNLQEALYGFCIIHGIPLSEKLLFRLTKRYYRFRKDSGSTIKKRGKHKKNYKKDSHEMSFICPEIVLLLSFCCPLIVL